MRLIIAGCRNLNPSYEFIIDAIRSFNICNIEEIISGGANGVDSEGEHLASHLNVKVTKFLPNWDEHGKAAGPIRNKQMAEYGDSLLLIWGGKSKGSASMKAEMLKLKKPVYEVVLKEQNI